MSITESEIYEKLKNINYRIKSVTRLINKNQLSLSIITIQLTKTKNIIKFISLKNY